MGWLQEVEANSALERVLGQRPELLARYRHFYASLFEGRRVPRRILEVCRLRIAAIHGCEAEWLIRDAGVVLGEAELAALRAGRYDDFSPSERASLALAERMPHGHHSITDEQVRRVSEDLGEAGCVALVTATAFFDVMCRLRLVLEIDGEAARLDPPPLKSGALV